MLSVQGQSEVIRYIPDFPHFQQFVSPKRMIVEQSRHQFGARRYLLNLYGVLLTIIFQNQSEINRDRCISDFPDFRQPCVSKKVGRRAKLAKIWASGVRIYCIQGTFDH